MSEEHKAALARGRSEGAAVRAYLEALETHRPKRGRKRTVEGIKAKLESIASELESATGIAKLDLMQERRDLEKELQEREEIVDISSLEQGFISVAKDYGDRKGIEYATWREFGVSAAVLKSAGIKRGS
ncbi:MAG: hypothetical protein R2770_11470 [Acidimicrobiales bacterium]|nr:hypothetical protein [Acidimicrobiales bacterium]